LVALSGLFARIPELQSTLDEYLNVAPLSFQIGGDSSRNMAERLKAVEEHTRKTGELKFDLPHQQGDKVTYVSIYPPNKRVDLDYLNSLGLPFTDIKSETDPVSMRTFFGKFIHPADKYWHQCIDLYKSGYSGTSYIVPLWGRINDPFVLHFMILYALSIVVRYRPSLWHDIEDGDLDNIRALIEHYLVIVDNTLPRLAVERITARRLLIVQPGSLFAPS
jgi:hypothetical protein